MERVYLKLYNNNDIYMSPVGTIMTSVEVYRDFPAAAQFDFIVETDAYSEVMIGFYSLNSMKSKYNIDDSLSKEDAVQAIEDAMNAEREAEEQSHHQQIITPEERIAAALEYQVLMSMEDAE